MIKRLLAYEKVGGCPSIWWVCSAQVMGACLWQGLCERYVQLHDGKHHSHYNSVEPLPCSYFAPPGAAARDEGQKSEHHAEGRSCDRSFVFADFFAFQSQISSSTFGLSLDISILVILDYLSPPCSSMAKADPFFLHFHWSLLPKVRCY